MKGLWTWLGAPTPIWVPGAFSAGKGGRCVRLTILPSSCAVVMKYENPKFLEPSGPLQACNGTTLPFKIVVFDEVYRVYTKEWCGFKSLQELYFSPYMGTTYTVSSSNCPSFSCATSSSLLMLTEGPRGQFPRWRRSRKRLSVCSVLRCSDLWLQCSVTFVHGLEKTHQPFPAATPSWKVAPLPLSKVLVTH